MILTPRQTYKGVRFGKDKDKCIMCEKKTQKHGDFFCNKCRKKPLFTKIYYYRKYVNEKVWSPGQRGGRRLKK